MLEREFGLSLSLHTPLSGWCDPTSYPREADLMDRTERRIANRLCDASRQHLYETLGRLQPWRATAQRSSCSTAPSGRESAGTQRTATRSNPPR